MLCSDRYHLMPSGDLQIFNAKESDSGIYKCIVYNPFLGQRKLANHHINLIVIKKSRHYHGHSFSHKNHDYIAPKFIVKPKSHINAILGSNVTIECAASGYPSPNITWKKADKHSKWRHLQYGGNLILTSVRRGDEGTYTCTASNGLSSASTISESSKLDIQEIPSILRFPESVNVLEGQELTLECATKGKPKPITTWIFNGKLIRIEELNKGILIKGSDGSKLSIPKTNSQLHSGIYQCFSTNELGSTYASSIVNIVNEAVNVTDEKSKNNLNNEEDDESDLNLNNNEGLSNEDEDDLFGHLPDSANRRRKNKNKWIKMVPPTKPEISRLSDESVMVRWDVPKNDGLPILFFKVQYREVGVKGGTWNTVDEDIAPHIHSYAVNGLKSGLKYKFRIAAVYSNNDNKLSPNSIKFTLYKDPPMKKPVYGPTIMNAEPVSPSAVSLRWEYLDIDSVAIEGFFIYYRATHTAGDYFKVTVEGANTRTHTITHLLPDTSYDIKMQCFNVAGTSDFSNIYTIKTLPTLDTTKGKGGKKDPVDININNNFGPVLSKDDKTLYFVLGIVIAALVLVFVVCIVLCLIRHKQQTPMPNMQLSNHKLPKEKHPKANINNHNHHSYNHHHSNHNIFTSHHRSNGHISNTLAAAASNGYLSRSNTLNTLESECTHQINIRVNPFCNEIKNGNSLTRTSSINETLKCISASHHQLSNNNVPTNDGPISLNTMERRKLKRVDEHYPNVHLSNPRLSNHHRDHNHSFTRLNGTLERKRRSRTDLLASDKELDNNTGRCNGTFHSTPSTNGTLVMMQSSC